MTYGFLPRNWPAFQRQLAERGLAMEDIEKVELRPTTTSGTTMDVVVTARSGDVHVFRQDEAEGNG
jgi:hypothetical protein